MDTIESLTENFCKELACSSDYLALLDWKKNKNLSRQDVEKRLEEQIRNFANQMRDFLFQPSCYGPAGAENLVWQGNTYRVSFQTHCEFETLRKALHTGLEKYLSKYTHTQEF